jgi:hypothetical protein
MHRSDPAATSGARRILLFMCAFLFGFRGLPGDRRENRLELYVRTVYIFIMTRRKTMPRKINPPETIGRLLAFHDQANRAQRLSGLGTSGSVPGRIANRKANRRPPAPAAE